MNCPDDVRLYLASSSARREQLLRQIGLNPISSPVDVDETPLPGERPVELVRRLARAKALHCRNVLTASGFDAHSWNTVHDIDDPASRHQARCRASHTCLNLVLAADTVIDLDGQIIGKPASREHCLQTLAALANRSHTVHSGVCVLSVVPDQGFTEVVSTEVTFGPISPCQALDYWETGEPHGKAGSYAIQGFGAMFVVRLNGSYSGVVGLPLYQTVALLEKAGLTLSMPKQAAENTDFER